MKRAFGTTLNDVVMAVTGAALRRYLESHNELPADPLKAMVPVSVRTKAQASDYTNRVTSVVAELATDEKDPVERLRRVHDAMGEAKRMQEATPADLLTDWTESRCRRSSARPSGSRRARRFSTAWNPPFNLIVSNVPGPRESLYLGGAEMLTYYPVSRDRRQPGIERDADQLPRPSRLLAGRVSRARAGCLGTRADVRRVPRRAGSASPRPAIDSGGRRSPTDAPPGSGEYESSDRSRLAAGQALAFSCDCLVAKARCLAACLLLLVPDASHATSADPQELVGETESAGSAAVEAVGEDGATISLDARIRRMRVSSRATPAPSRRKRSSIRSSSSGPPSSRARSCDSSSERASPSRARTS